MLKLLRYLRIAFSAACVVVAVLLCALWVRSERHFDEFGWGMSAQGKLYLSPKVNLFPIDGTAPTLESSSHFGGRMQVHTVWNAQLVPIAGTGPVVPYWCMVLVTSLLTSAPWIGSRFSLRTLLIATTLVAVVLGVIVWAVR